MSILQHFRDRLGLTQAKAQKHQAEEKVGSTVKYMQELEDSQQGLKSAIQDTGFFLGDALRIERAHNERSRARTGRHQS